MKYIPHEYQEEDINFLLDDKIGGLFEDMGLGKSSVVLSTINQAMFDRLDVDHAIILGPKNVILNQWPGEIEKWDMSQDISYTVLHGDEKDVRLRESHSIYLMNFDGLHWLLKQYTGKSRRGLPLFQMVVIDESTYIKNQSTQRYTILNRLFRDVQRKIILTGTPTPNGLIDLYGQISFLDDRVLGVNLTSFRNNYFIAPSGHGGDRKYKPRRGSRELITQRIAHLVKIRKAKDHLKMKEIRLNNIKCVLPEQKQKEYDELEKDFFTKLDNDKEIEVFNPAALSNKLRQYIQGFVYHEDTDISVTNRVKLDVLAELIQSVNGQPILCATQFLAEVPLIRDYFNEDIPAINSKTPSRVTSEHIVNWNKGNIPLLLAHPQSIGHGINMQQGGNILVWLGLPWALDHYLQTIGRLDRQGQEEGVIVHHCVMQNTVDQAIMSALRYKDNEQKRIVSSLQHYRESKGA